MELSKVDLSRFYGVHVNTISQWVSKGCPFISKGSGGRKWVFSSAAVTAWREDQIAQQALGDVTSLDIDEARRRKLAAEAALTELDLSHRRGELIEIEYIADLVGDEYANVRAKILALPTKLAPLLLGLTSLTEVRGIIETGIIEALEELTADEIYSGTGEGDQAAKESESQAAA
jgi:phage terminase Nu1 subunit (DNA packaging protein)